MKDKDKNKFWNSFARKYDNFIARHANKTYEKSLNLICKELMKKYKVLEVGTGTGIVAFAIASEVSEIVALDFAPEMIRIAKEKQEKMRLNNITFKVSNAIAIDFPDGSFDVAIASNVFHLIPNASEALNEFHRLLIENGKVILPTYCHGQNLKTKIISKIISLIGFKTPNRWSVKEFRNFVEKGGFKVEKEEIISDKIPLSFIVASKKS